METRREAPDQLVNSNSNNKTEITTTEHVALSQGASPRSSQEFTDPLPSRLPAAREDSRDELTACAGAAKPKT